MAKKDENASQDAEKQEEQVSTEPTSETKPETTSESPNYEEKISNLEKKLGEMGSRWDETQEFINGASVVINTLAYTPELREAFQAQLKKQGVVGAGEGAGQQQAQVPQTDQAATTVPSQTSPVERKVADLESANRERTIMEFEREFGIADLKDDEKKQARRKIEGYLNDFGWSVNNIPLTNLRQSLEKSYWGTNIDKLKEEGKLEGYAQSRQNQMGTMGQISGGAPNPGANQNNLSDKQREWIKKLGADEEKAKEVWQNRDSEQTRKSKSEKSN